MIAWIYVFMRWCNSQCVFLFGIHVFLFCYIFALKVAFGILKFIQEVKLSKEFGSVWLIKENSVSFFIVTNVNTEWTFFQHRHGNFYRVQTLCIQNYSMRTIWWSQQQTNKQQLRQQQRWWQSPENTEKEENVFIIIIISESNFIQPNCIYVLWISIIENSFKQTQPKMLKLIFNSSKAKKKEKCEMWWYFPLMIQKVNNNTVLLSSGSNLTLFRFDSLFCLFVWMNVCYVCENNKTNTHTQNDNGQRNLSFHCEKLRPGFYFKFCFRSWFWCVWCDTLTTFLIYLYF